MSHVSHLECSVCGRRHEAGRVQTLCECGGPLLVRYDLEKAKATWSRDSLAKAPPNMWRYAPLLPVKDSKHIVSLGEGLTPIMKTDRLAAHLGVSQLWVKDEGANPTGSFKDRGMSCALSMCLELGLSKIAVASAGNAGSSLAAYAAASGQADLVKNLIAHKAEVNAVDKSGVRNGPTAPFCIGRHFPGSARKDGRLP